MIVGHEHKYVFVEFPQTGCSAVAQELMTNYGGERVLYKHAQFHEFRKKFSDRATGYYAFSTIRNPMDIVVSKYFKYKTNHKNYVDKKIRFGKLRRVLMPGYERTRRDFVQQTNADFESFFLKFFNLPYSAWSITNHPQLDYVMRFENLVADFEQVLKNIGIEPLRPLPVFNKTGEKKKHFTEYYASPEARIRAVKVFGPYMKQWGYEFPESWPEAASAGSNEQMYNFINSFRRVYWNLLR